MCFNYLYIVLCYNNYAEKSFETIVRYGANTGCKLFFFFNNNFFTVQKKKKKNPPFWQNLICFVSFSAWLVYIFFH